MNDKKNLYDVISEFEGASVFIENSLYLLQVYEEFLDREVANVTPEEPWTADLFLRRYELAKSQTFGISTLLGKALDQMKVTIDEGYNTYHTIKETKER